MTSAMTDWVKLHQWFEDYKFVSAQASNFGSVIELDDQVIVLRGGRGVVEVFR